MGNSQDQLVISGDTGHYKQLRERVANLVTPGSQILNLDYDLLRSGMGILFAVNLVLLGLFDLLTCVVPDILFERMLGTVYSWADLYPYLFLGLIIPLLWWGIIQPLRQHIHLWPRGHLALWVLGVGLLLTLVQAATCFRPLLTVANVYPPFTTIVILVGAGIAIWRTEMAKQKVYPAPLRIGVAIVVILACGLLLSVLHRDVRASQTAAAHGLGTDHVASDVQVGQTLSQVVQLQAGIKQRPQHHVAADPGETVEVCNAHQSSSCSIG
mgnify:CR=1 FL=1